MVIIAVVAAVIGGYIFMQNSDETMSRQTDPQTNGQAGVIAMLGQQQAAQPQVQAESITPQPVETPETKPVENEPPVDETIEPYDLKLPEGWKKKDSKDVEKSCVTGKDAIIDTYQKGAETIKVYENTRPGGCNGKTVADVDLAFTFNEDGEGLKVATGKIKQCSKDENELCPKGDGRVSVFISNLQESELISNPKTGNGYFIEIVDTEVDASLETQVKKLAKLVQDITF